MGAGHRHRGLYVAGDRALHRLAPEAKLAAAVAYVLCVALTPARAVVPLLVDLAAIATVLVLSGLSPRRIAARIAGVVPFIAFAFAIPFVAAGDQVEIAGVSLSADGLWGTWNIVAKALIGVATSIALAATTTTTDLTRAMTRLRVPVPFAAIALFMFRYLDLVAAELDRMRVAMTSRGHDPRWLWQARPIATAAGALFVRSYERGERVHAAMVSRGYTGTIPDIDSGRATAGHWAVVALLPALAIAGAIGARW